MPAAAFCCGSRISTAGRCRAEYAAAILEDLAWLGLDWDGEVRRQSEHFDDYRRGARPARGAARALPVLLHPPRHRGRDRAGRRGAAGRGRAALSRHLPAARPGGARQRQNAGRDYALRLDVARALALTGPLGWVEEGGAAPRRVEADPAALGDVVLARKEMPASYHLAVTVDDAIQGVTLVTRGDDLAPSTHIHRLLQALLDLPTPRYRHHPLLTDATGRRLAKRDRAQTIRAMRAAGMSPAEIVSRAVAAAD